MNDTVQLQSLIANYDKLEKRKDLIEDLRRRYFAALENQNIDERREMLDERRVILNEAQGADVELFSDMPLSRVREIEAINKLTLELKQHEKLLLGGVAAAGLLDKLKEFDVDRLSEKLEQLKQVTEQTEGVVQQAREQERKTELLVTSIDQRRQQVLLVSMLDTLLWLRMLSPEKYGEKALAMVLDLEDKSGRLTEPKKSQVSGLVDTARRDWTEWGDVSTEEMRALENTDKALEAGGEVNEVDKNTLNAIEIEHPIVMHLRSQLAGQESGVAGGFVPPASQQKVQELIQGWWLDWRNFAKTGILEKKMSGLEDIQRQFQGLSQAHYRDALGDPLFQEVVLAWQRRIKQALRMSTSLMHFQELLKGMKAISNNGRSTGSSQTSSEQQASSNTDSYFDEKDGRHILDHMDKLYQSTQPEVFYLFHQNWKETISDVMKRISTDTGEVSDGSMTFEESMKDFQDELKEKMEQKYKDGSRVIMLFAQEENNARPNSYDSHKTEW